MSSSLSSVSRSSLSYGIIQTIVPRSVATFSIGKIQSLDQFDPLRRAVPSDSDSPVINGTACLPARPLRTQSFPLVDTASRSQVTQPADRECFTARGSGQALRATDVDVPRTERRWSRSARVTWLTGVCHVGAAREGRVARTVGGPPPEEAGRRESGFVARKRVRSRKKEPRRKS